MARRRGTRLVMSFVSTARRLGSARHSALAIRGELRARRALPMLRGVGAAAQVSRHAGAVGLVPDGLGRLVFKHLSPAWASCACPCHPSACPCYPALVFASLVVAPPVKRRRDRLVTAVTAFQRAAKAAILRGNVYLVCPHFRTRSVASARRRILPCGRPNSPLDPPCRSLSIQPEA